MSGLIRLREPEERFEVLLSVANRCDGRAETAGEWLRNVRESAPGHGGTHTLASDTGPGAGNRGSGVGPELCA